MGELEECGKSYSCYVGAVVEFVNDKSEEDWEIERVEQAGFPEDRCIQVFLRSIDSQRGAFVTFPIKEVKQFGLSRKLLLKSQSKAKIFSDPKNPNTAFLNRSAKKWF